MIFFPGQGKVRGNFDDGQENVERIWIIREKSGNLKINGYGSVKNMFCSLGKGCTFS